MLTIVLSASIALVVAEILVRLTLRYNNPDTVRENSLQYIPSVFARHRLKPNQDVNTEETWGEPRMDSQRGLRYIINEQGYRGSRISIPKDEGICRIVVLGGSAVFGAKAPDGNDWPHLVEQYLREKGYENIEVVNGGVPGHASFDSLGRLYSQVWMFEPDVVLIYNAWNDIKFLRFIDGKGQSVPLISIVRPYDKTANPFTNYRNEFDRLLSASQIYVKLRTRYYRWKLRIGLEGLAPEGQYTATAGRLGLRQYRLNFELIVDTARNIGAVPILLTQATLVSTDNTPEDRKRIGYEYQQMDHATLAKAFDDCNDVIRSVADEKGVACLDLAEQLSGKSEMFVDHVHFTDKGRMEVGRTVGQFLETMLGKGELCTFIESPPVEVGSVWPGTS